MVDAMKSEKPRKYWKNLPEADLIPGLIRNANTRTHAMLAAAPTEASPCLLSRAKAMVAQSQPEGPTDGLAGLRAAAGHCARCPLHATATQAVCGVGLEDAALMIVGEQTGDTEDLTGVPFTGPAGRLFDAEAQAAGLDRAAAYVTDAVKHFKFSPRGKWRIHQRPDAGEVTACRWWLDQERALIRPRLILAMGATALASLTGTGERILAQRGTLEVAGDGAPVFLTVHPSYILRLSHPALQLTERFPFATTCGWLRRWLAIWRATECPPPICTMGRTEGAGHHFDRH